jgi:hypothetical protein
MALYLTSRLETNALIQASATDAVRLSVRRADLVGMGCERHPLYFPSSSGLKMLAKRLIHCIGGELLHVGDDMRVDVQRDRH